MKTLYKLCCAALLGLSLPAHAQMITTFAGDAISGAGYSGDGGSASLAQLNHPRSVAFDDTGNAYIVDAYNNMIRKVAPSSIISTFTGVISPGYSGDGFPATAGQYDHPNYVLADQNNRIYICDPSNQAIRMIDNANIVSTIVGDGTATPGYSGDGGPATAALINFPSAIALDNSGNLYIADQGNNVIRKVDAAGIITTIAGTGNTGYSGEGGPATAADLGFPYGLAVDDAGNIYVGLYFEGRVVKIDAATSTVTTYAGIGGGTGGYGGDGGPATAATFDGLWGICLDAAGNLYIADNVNQRVRKVDASTGIINTVAGNGSSGFSGNFGPATAAQLRDPVGVTVSADGSIYISEYNNHIVRKVAGSLTHPPVFAGGSSQTLTLCMNDPATSINSLLDVTDIDAGQNERWTEALAPTHGTLVATYSTLSTGGTLTPAGLTYMPDASYSGTDSFKVRIFDGTAADTTTIVVTINSCTGNIPPSFTGGGRQTLTLCKNDPATSINTLLAVADADAGQAENWTVALTPLHGTLAATYSTLSTGGTLTPTGLTYTPAAGYAGDDSFKVRIFDGTDADTTTVVVTINPCSGNGAPSFTGGKTQVLNICKNATPTSINTQLSVADPDPGQTITWSVIMVPSFGTLAAVYSTLSTGGTLVPAGLSYQAISGYTGTDVFKVRVSDGTASDTTTINVTITECATSVPGVNGKENSMEIFPNPNSGTFTFSLGSAENEPVKVTIVNVTGEKISEQTTATNTPTEIKMNIPPGIYILEATSAHGKWSRRVTVKP